MAVRVVKPSPAPNPVVDVIAGWMLPGLGHFLRGQRGRGLIIGITILALWLSGLLVGGLGSIDSGEHRLWFIGQALVGPSILVEVAQRQTPLMKQIVPAVGRPEEQGVLYCALAGLLNLLALVDLALPRRREAEPAPAPATPTAAPEPPPATTEDQP